MPDWLIQALTHLGASAPLVLFLVWLYQGERKERVETAKMVLDLTREVLRHTAEQSHIAGGVAEKLETLGDKIDDLLTKRERGR